MIFEWLRLIGVSAYAALVIRGGGAPVCFLTVGNLFTSIPYNIICVSIRKTPSTSILLLLRDLLSLNVHSSVIRKEIIHYKGLRSRDSKK